MGKKDRLYDFPVKYFEDNLLFDDSGSCWACYEVICEEYTMLSEYGKHQYIARLARLLAGIGDRAKIFVIPVKQDLEKSRQYELEEIEKRGAGTKTSEYAKAYINSAYDTLGEAIALNGGTNDYKVFICTKLEKPAENLTLQNIVQNPIGVLEEKLGYVREAISVKEIQEYKQAAARYQRMQASRFAIEPLDTDQIQWLIGRMFLRGSVEEPYIRQNLLGKWKPFADEIEIRGERYKKPDKGDLIDLYNYYWGQDSKFADYITIRDEKGKETYQTFLALSHLPEDLNIPGDEWIKPLLDLPFGVEICISVETSEYKKAIKELKDNKKKIEGQDEHAQMSGEVSDEDIEKAYIDSTRFEDDLEPYNDPMISFALTIALANADLEALRSQVMQVKQELERPKFRVQKPISDQMRLFMEMIPGAPLGFNNYIKKTSPTVLATSVFPVAVESGDDVGHFIGTAGSRGKYIFLSPTEAIRNNRSGGIAILGTLGGGKSVLANFIAYIIVMLDSGRSLIIDPKSERGKLWEYFLKEFEGEIGTVKIDYTDRGVFDPFVIYRPETEEWFNENAEDLAKTMQIYSYSEYLENRNTDARSLATAMFTEELNLELGTTRNTAFAEAVEAASNCKWELPSMELVTRFLAGEVPEEYKLFSEDDPVKADAELLARDLRQLKKSSKLGGLLIGNGTEKGLAFNKRINIMQIQGLSIPDPDTDKRHYTAVQRTSATIMMPLGEFAREFTRNPMLANTPKAVIFDESWFLKATAQGALLYEEIARTGRSLYSIPIFIGHSVADVDEPGIRESLTYLFVFKMATETEAREALRILGLEDTADNMSLVMSLGNGQCLFKDFKDRVQLIQVQLPFTNLINAFETNPEKREKLLEEMEQKEKGVVDEQDEAEDSDEDAEA